MIQTIRSSHGMAVAPNSLAAQSALSVLRDGGNASVRGADGILQGAADPRSDGVVAGY